MKGAYQKKQPKNVSRSDLLALIFASDTDFDKISRPKKNYWYATNVDNPVFLGRTGWGSNDMFVGIKGGRANISHAHMDASSFVFDAIGERWAFDLGRQDYNSIEKLGMKLWNFTSEGDRWKIFRLSNASHNLVIANDSVMVYDADAAIVETFTDKNKIGAKVDYTKTYGSTFKKAVREAAIIGGQKLRVTDSIENSSKPTKIRWNICTYDTAKIIDKHTVEITSPKEKKLTMKLISPENFSAKNLTANPENAWDEKNPGKILSGFEGELAEDEKCEIVVELIPQK